MTGLQKAVAELDAHVAALPDSAKAAAVDIVRALAPLLGARSAELDALMTSETFDRILAFAKAAMLKLATSGQEATGVALVAALDTHAPGLALALRAAERVAIEGHVVGAGGGDQADYAYKGPALPAVPK